MSHYTNVKIIKSIADIKNIFPDGEANELNWCIFSTSGVHGTYNTLDDVEKYYANPENEEGCHRELTVLVIQPRLVSMKYGNIEVELEDIPFLRKLVNSSIEAMRETQKENL